MLAEFIKGQRKKRGLTQEYLASKIGVSRPTYVQIEQGGRELTISEAKKLADVFDINLEDLLRENEGGKTIVRIEKISKREKNTGNDIRISIPQQKADKFKQVLLYILKKAGGKPNVGLTVLYKLLYFIDFDFYEKYEEQLMGLIYLKNKSGPTPLLFEKLMQDMLRRGEVELIKSRFYKYPQQKYLVNPEIEPDLRVLSGQEKEHIDWELHRLSDMTAAQISELSHRDIPWISAENGKPLEYEAVFYRTSETSIREY